MKANWNNTTDILPLVSVCSVATLQGAKLDILIRSNKKLAKTWRLLKRERESGLLLLPRRIGCADNSRSPLRTRKLDKTCETTSLAHWTKDCAGLLPPRSRNEMSGPYRGLILSGGSLQPAAA